LSNDYFALTAFAFRKRLNLLVLRSNLVNDSTVSSVEAGNVRIASTNNGFYPFFGFNSEFLGSLFFIPSNIDIHPIQ